MRNPSSMKDEIIKSIKYGKTGKKPEIKCSHENEMAYATELFDGNK